MEDGGGNCGKLDEDTVAVLGTTAIRLAMKGGGGNGCGNGCSNNENMTKMVVAALEIRVEDGVGNCGKLNEDTMVVSGTKAIRLERTCGNGRWRQ